ncbi:MAG TPA: UDP-N-acetylglucosamine 1-carboxyvinyltransferase, partial [Ruminococcaceae bacterium]|nr:UDP-N-acetylglucosamine 1-carboxyvinyltransferase [Oscillospiraceae bacterium]
MDKFLINGGNQLQGEIKISGAKNAAIAIIPAAILSDDVCRIENVPNITDVNAMILILRDIGVDVRWVSRSALVIDPRPLGTYVAPYELAGKMRGSYYLMGALLGRCHHAIVSMPGGCNFGVRPIDLHLKGFSGLGAKYSLEGGMVNVS